MRLGTGPMLAVRALLTWNVLSLCGWFFDPSVVMGQQAPAGYAINDATILSKCSGCHRQDQDWESKP